MDFHGKNPPPASRATARGFSRTSPDKGLTATIAGRNIEGAVRDKGDALCTGEFFARGFAYIERGRFNGRMGRIAPPPLVPSPQMRFQPQRNSTGAGGSMPGTLAASMASGAEPDTPMAGTPAAFMLAASTVQRSSIIITEGVAGTVALRPLPRSRGPVSPAGYAPKI
jgi:hypothetical protein